MSGLREISLQEVQTHYSTSDAWIILNNVVYDITTFLPLHPGGEKILIPLLGQDATNEFDDVGHSEEAKKMLIPMTKGKLAATSTGMQHSMTRTIRSTTTQQKPSTIRERGQQKKEENESYNSDPQSSVIDLNKPLILQIYRLTLSQYSQFTQEKIYNPDSYKMFANPILEFLSRTKWLIVPMVWIPISFIVLIHGFSYFHSYGMHFIFLPILWLFGAFLWTFIEYIFHRFIFHFDEELLPDSGIAFAIHFSSHAIHHVFPMDRLRLVMPPALFAVLASPVFVLTKFVLCLPNPILYPLWSGRLYSILS